MAKPVNPLDLLKKGARTSTEKKSKSKTPIVSSADENVKTAIETWKDAKQREKDAKAERELVEEVLRPFGMEARRELIQREQTHHTSIKINGQVTMKVSKSYSEIPLDNQEELEEIFGEDEFERLFMVHTSIEFNEQFVGDPEVLQAVIDAVGADKFHEIFKVVQTVKPKEALVHERDMNPEVAEKHDQAVADGLVKPYRSSFVR
jgi:hypothetical protein